MKLENYDIPINEHMLIIGETWQCNRGILYHHRRSLLFKVLFLLSSIIGYMCSLGKFRMWSIFFFHYWLSRCTKKIEIFILIHLMLIQNDFIRSQQKKRRWFSSWFFLHRHFYIPSNIKVWWIKFTVILQTCCQIELIKRKECRKNLNFWLLLEIKY